MIALHGARLPPARRVHLPLRPLTRHNRKDPIKWALSSRRLIEATLIATALSVALACII